MADLAIEKGLDLLYEAYSPTYIGLPNTVRHRATGAMRVWNEAIRAAGANGRELAERLSDPNEPVLDLYEPMANFLDAHSSIDFETQRGSQAKHLASQNTYLQAFWSRSGALYEPTSALHRLLDTSDIGTEIPMRMLQMPSPAVCVVASPEMRDDPNGFSTITIFEHPADPRHGHVNRTLTMFIASGVNINNIVLEQVDDDISIAALLELARQRILIEPGRDQTVEAAMHLISQQLAYVTKLLLYLSVEGAKLDFDAAYSQAPRTFPGLGKRKREQRLANIEQLYDRYIVGPIALAEHEAMPSGGQEGQHEVSAHWRRGHFRLQAHGPAMALRKVMFIKPTLIRADRIANRLDQ
jgi:hypothetical protein